MKNSSYIRALVGVAVTVLFSGCSDKPETTTEAPASAAESRPAASNALTNTVQQSATNLAPTIVVAAQTNVPLATSNPASAVVVSAPPAMQFLERIQQLLAEKKYTEAAAMLGSVDSQNLNSEQKTLWQSLQAEVQKGLATQASKSAKDSATKSVGGLIGK